MHCKSEYFVMLAAFNQGASSVAVFVSSFLHLAATVPGMNEPIKRKSRSILSNRHSFYSFSCARATAGWVTGARR